MHSYEDYDYTEKLKEENQTLTKILDANTQKLAAYRDFIKLIGNMKACERFIDKEKAFDEIMKYLEENVPEFSTGSEVEV